MKRTIIALVFLVLALLFLGAKNSFGQSQEFKDYVKIFEAENNIYYADKTSVKPINPDNNPAFWLLNYRDKKIKFVLLEVDCKLKQSRLRMIGDVTEGKAEYFPATSPWYGKDDKVASAAVAYICDGKKIAIDLVA